MQVFMVGGAVRDLLLGRPVSDRDWVVVGATPEDMVRAGFTPVGHDFPVFLHPQTKEQYALARTERKTSPGYHGFAFHADPTVTLEQDLARRDLTINAMAQDPQGALIDPFGGRRDLAARVLRHVSPAFAEDPVRILRLARFAARFTDFSVAAETLELARRIVAAGEANALVAERVWQELSRGLMEARPSRMLDVLRECGALAVLLPQVDALWARGPSGTEPPAQRILRALDLAAAQHAPLAVRFACLGHDLDLGHALAAQPPQRSGRVAQRLALLRSLCAGLRVPVECSQLAEVVVRVFDDVDRCLDSDASTLFDLVERCDALRRPQRLHDIVLACECIARAIGGADDPEYLQRGLLMRALGAALSVPSADIAARAIEQGQTGTAIGLAVRRARIAAIETFLRHSAHEVSRTTPSSGHA